MHRWARAAKKKVSPQAEVRFPFCLCFSLTLLDSLGDRHGENILFDSMTGDTVHVDFNCLFEKVSWSSFLVSVGNNCIQLILRIEHPNSRERHLKWLKEHRSD